MTLKELYEEAKEKGWENLQVKVLIPGTISSYGNKTNPTVSNASLVHRDKDFWPGVNEEFLAFI